MIYDNDRQKSPDMYNWQIQAFRGLLHLINIFTLVGPGFVLPNGSTNHICHSKAKTEMCQ